MITIENNQLKVNISTKGAELMNVYHKTKKREYLWQGNPSFWKRRSPLLFPIVGTLAEDTYYLNGNKYSLSRHGFARDYEFTVVSNNTEEASFLLKSNNDTLKMYPFYFSLLVTYKLMNNRIQVLWKVINQGQETMYFQIGAHPAFNVDDTDGLLDDYELWFDESKSLKTRRLNPETGLITEGRKTLVEHSNKLQLSYSLFDQDALIVDDLEHITLRNKKSLSSVKLSFESFPLLGIWTPIKEEKTPFICIEPWYGLADTTEYPQEIKDKAFINTLHSQREFNASYTMEFN